MLKDFDLIRHSFPDCKGIDIYPIADVHLGAIEHAKDEWEDFIKRVKDENAYLVSVGEWLSQAHQEPRPSCQPSHTNKQDCSAKQAPREKSPWPCGKPFASEKHRHREASEGTALLIPRASAEERDSPERKLPLKKQRRKKS